MLFTATLPLLVLLLLGCLVLRTKWYTPLLKPKSFFGKVVLITGGGSGVGKQMARIFHQCGAVVVVWDILDDCPFDTPAYPRLHYFKCDVTDCTAVKQIASKVASIVGPVDILVNNAGVVRGKPLLDLSDEEIEQVLRVNCLSHFWTVKAFLPTMLERGSGHIVTMASVLGLAGSANMAPYITSKFGAFGFGESLRLELYRMSSSIQTTLVCPGHISTPMFQNIRMGMIARWLSPALSPADVASRTVEAVLKNQTVLVMPYHLWMTVLVRAIVPVWIFDKLLYLSGSLHAMDDFTLSQDDAPKM